MDKPIPEAVRRAIYSNDLYQVLIDVKNGIDSKGLRDMANSAIRRIDSARDALAAAQQQGQAAPGSRAWMAEVCRAAALSLAAHGVRNDQLSKVADWIAQQPTAVDEAVGTVTRVGSFEVQEHRIELDPEFDERLNYMPEGTVVRLYAAPVRDLTQQQLADAAAALAAQHQEPTT